MFRSFLDNALNNKFDVRISPFFKDCEWKKCRHKIYKEYGILDDIIPLISVRYLEPFEKLFIYSQLAYTKSENLEGILIKVAHFSDTPQIYLTLAKMIPAISRNTSIKKLIIHDKGKRISMNKIIYEFFKIHKVEKYYYLFVLLFKNFYHLNYGQYLWMLWEMQVKNDP